MQVAMAQICFRNGLRVSQRAHRSRLGSGPLSQLRLPPELGPATISAGFENSASGPLPASAVACATPQMESVVIGSQNITDNKNNSIALQPRFP
jgi:hypothetical protein